MYCKCYYCKVNRAKVKGHLCVRSPRALLLKREGQLMMSNGKAKDSGCCCEELYNNPHSKFPEKCFDKMHWETSPGNCTQKAGFNHSEMFCGIKRYFYRKKRVSKGTRAHRNLYGRERWVVTDGEASLHLFNWSSSAAVAQTSSKSEHSGTRNISWWVEISVTRSLGIKSL